MDLRGLPQVDALARVPELSGYPESVRVAAARSAVAGARESLRSGSDADPVALAIAEAERRVGSTLRGAINLSGVILHTGLGRARLAAPAVARMHEVAAGYANIEFDLASGERGDRQGHVRDLLRELTGAEDALVVNNAAAGVTLALATLAAGRDVVLSRGQMVEIGGSFRLPEIVVQSGCRLVEVGCTNRTRLEDYVRATTTETAGWLRCHPSNYRIVGFTSEPSLSALAAAAHANGVGLWDDQGNGCLVDMARYGAPPVETLPQSVQHAHVSIASGDKLLGGPQAGIIVGRADQIREISRHPLARAFRIDKLTLAALEATLRLYTTGRAEEIPTIQAIAMPLDEVRRAAETLAEAWPGSIVGQGKTEVGSGSVPGDGIATWRVGLTGEPIKVARELRLGNPPVVGRIEANRVWLDPRTLSTDELPAATAALRRLAP